MTTSRDPLATPHTDNIQLTKGTWLIVLTATGNSSGVNIGTPSISGATQKGEYTYAYASGLSNARQKMLLVEVKNSATITVTVAFPGNNGVDLWTAWKLY